MANFFTVENGKYFRVPSATPMSLEMLVGNGDRVQTAYHDLRATLEKQEGYQHDPYYAALYAHLPKKRIPELQSAPDSKKRKEDHKDQLVYEQDQGDSIKSH